MKPSPFAHVQHGASGDSLRHKAGLPAEAKAAEGSLPTFAKASGGSLRHKAGLPAEALAKAGGGQGS